MSNESDGVITSSYFGGFRYLSNGMLQSTFRNRHNMPKTTSVSKAGAIVNTTLLLNPYGKMLNRDLNLANSHQNRGFNITENAKVYGDGYRDFESGLIYMGARFYNPNLNRFMAQDSYDVSNRYNYANANPIMMYDPDGHMSVWEGINIGLNGLGLIGGVAAAFASGGAAAPLIGGVLGAISGITGGVGIGLKHTKGFEEESQLLDVISTTTGIASLISDASSLLAAKQIQQRMQNIEVNRLMSQPEFQRFKKLQDKLAPIRKMKRVLEFKKLGEEHNATCFFNAFFKAMERTNNNYNNGVERVTNMFDSFIKKYGTKFNNPQGAKDLLIVRPWNAYLGIADTLPYKKHISFFGDVYKLEELLTHDNTIMFSTKNHVAAIYRQDGYIFETAWTHNSSTGNVEYLENNIFNPKVYENNYIMNVFIGSVHKTVSI